MLVHKFCSFNQVEHLIRTESVAFMTTQHYLYIIMYRNSTVTVHTNSSNDQEFEEKCFDNPTYGDTVTTEPNTTSQNGSHELEKNLQVTYDVINLPTNTTAVEDGQAYDVLNRGQAKCNNVYGVLY